MIGSAKLATLLAASSLLVVGAISTASAASPVSEAFLANVRPNVDFLDRSSRLAMTQSSSPRVRAFAHSEAKEQTITANSLVAFQSANGDIALVGPATGLGTGALTPVVGLATLPLDVAANLTTGIGDNVGNVLSGRSVAIDNPLAPRPVGAQPLLAAGADDLVRLQTMSGRDFDALYRSTQTDALRQLATLYRDYIQNGDDDALRALASRELPKINVRLRELNAI